MACPACRRPTLGAGRCRGCQRKDTTVVTAGDPDPGWACLCDDPDDVDTDCPMHGK